MGLSNFRDILDIWDEYLVENEIDNKINSIIDSQGFIMFFKKEDAIYGATEDGRLVFAKMKHPDDEMPSGWEEEASFSAHDISKLIKGENAEHLFRNEDLKKLKIMDREDAIEALKKTTEVNEKDFPNLTIARPNGLKILRISVPSTDDAPNLTRTDEE